MDNIDRLSIQDSDRGAILAVKVVPGSSRDRIVGVLDDALKIATAAPAEKGKANAAVARTLAKALGVSPRDVELITRAINPRKEFRIGGLAEKAVRQRISELSKSKGGP